MTSKTLFSPEPHKGWLPWGLLAPFLCIVFVAVCALGPNPLLQRHGWVDARGAPVANSAQNIRTRTSTCITIRPSTKPRPPYSRLCSRRLVRFCSRTSSSMSRR